MNNHQNEGVRPILTHQPRPEGITMDDEMYYEYIGIMLEIRLSSGADGLISRTWPVEAEVRQ